VAINHFVCALESAISVNYIGVVGYNPSDVLRVNSFTHKMAASIHACLTTTHDDEVISVSERLHISDLVDGDNFMPLSHWEWERSHRRHLCSLVGSVYYLLFDITLVLLSISRLKLVDLSSLSEVVDSRLRLTYLIVVKRDVWDVSKLVIGLEFIHGLLEIIKDLRFG